MTPATVNAYYNPQMNDINFPAGVLQPPLYDPKMDDAPNYGNTGGTIGHELTHGFDDEGSQFERPGQSRDWWTKDDREKFDARTNCMSDQYAQICGCRRYAHQRPAHHRRRCCRPRRRNSGLHRMEGRDQRHGLQPVDGLTPDQRFFVGFAQWACANERPEDMRIRAQVDPHRPYQSFFLKTQEF